MTARRVVAAGLVALGVVGCLRAPDLIEREAQSVRDRTVPAGARITSVDSLYREGASARARWTIEIDTSWEQYAQWVTAQLPEYRPSKPEAAMLLLNRHTEGDSFAVTLRSKTTSKTTIVDAAFVAVAF